MALIRFKNESYTPSEHQIQSAYFDYVRFKANEDYRYLNIIAIPNQGHTSVSWGAKRKAEGLSKGFPDVMIVIANTKDSHGAFLEFKTRHGILSKSQKDWKLRLEQNGYLYHIPRSVEDAINFTDRYFGNS